MRMKLNEQHQEGIDAVEAFQAPGAVVDVCVDYFNLTEEVKRQGDHYTH